MYKYIIKRLLLMIPVILGVTIIIFTIMYFTPGDPASIILGSNATPDQLIAKRIELGLDQSYLQRLFEYLNKAFLHFDIGNSYITGTSVAAELMARFPRTLILAVTSIIVSLVIGIPLGIYAAMHQSRLGDYLAMIIALLGVSMPSFWVALILVLELSVKLGLLPSSGIGGPQYYVLPCIANALGGIAITARLTRSSMLEVIRADYITTARAKGVSEGKVIYKHALKNALIPVITVAGQNFATLLGGAMIIETIFAIPGVGIYMISAVSNRDYPVIEGSVIIVAIAFSIIMLLVDIIYAFVDPRIKSQYSKK